MKLTLRDLFWLVALMAIGAGWRVDHREKETATRHLNAMHKWLADNDFFVEPDASEIFSPWEWVHSCEICNKRFVPHDHENHSALMLRAEREGWLVHGETGSRCPECWAETQRAP